MAGLRNPHHVRVGQTFSNVNGVGRWNDAVPLTPDDQRWRLHAMHAPFETSVWNWPDELGSTRERPDTVRTWLRLCRLREEIVRSVTARIRKERLTQGVIGHGHPVPHRLIVPPQSNRI